MPEGIGKWALGVKSSSVVAPTALSKLVRFANCVIVAGPPVDDVVAALAEQEVAGAGVVRSRQRVVAGAADHDFDVAQVIIVDIVAESEARAEVYGDRVGRTGKENGVGAAAAVVTVIARAAGRDDRVVAEPAFDEIVAGAAGNNVVAVAAVQRVVEVRADDGVRAVRAGENHGFGRTAEVEYAGFQFFFDDWFFFFFLDNDDYFFLFIAGTVVAAGTTAL